MSNLLNIINDYKQAKKQFMDVVSTALSEEFKEFFKSNPTVACVKWRQSVPNFNDGSPCVFHVHDIYISNSLECTFDGDFEEPEDGDWVYPNYSYSKYIPDAPEEIIDSIKPFRVLLSMGEMEEVLQTYGDNVEVTVTPDGIEIEEYYDY